MNAEDIIKFIIIGIILVILILLCVLFFMYYKDKLQKNNNEDQPIDNKDEKKDKKSIFKFMEFDNIEDNMISQDGGKRYLMVIECKGVNYDLLSEVEKTSIEQGFLQFLNTLKYEIQIYVQTRKINLSKSTSRYRERLKAIELDMRNEEMKFEDMKRSNEYTRAELIKEAKEVTKKKNLYEYGKDLIENTEQMSKDKNLTTKQYYIIVPYYTEEISSAGDYDKREISSMAFSELYTRAQALVSGLYECEVQGHIMNSYELIELLYVAYNREQYDKYDFNEYLLKSGYQYFYSIAPDVLDKRIVALDEEIRKKANEKAVEAFGLASKEVVRKRKLIEDREKRMQEYIDSLASNIIDNETAYIGTAMANLSKEQIKKMTERENAKNENQESQNENHQDIVVETSHEELPKKKRKLSDLTEEERKRRRALLKKKKLRQMREAQKNEKKED